MQKALRYARLVPPPGPLETVVDPEDPRRTARIENVVVSYRIVTAKDGRRVSFNLARIAERARSLYPAFYDARTLRALKFRLCLHHPATQPTALLFSTGQVNQAGEQVPENARHIAHMLALMLSRIVGVTLAVSNFTITNMVAHTRLPSEMELAFLVSVVGKHRISFDSTPTASDTRSPSPGMGAPGVRPFSAARVKPETLPKMKFSFFRSGAVVMPGAKNREQFITAMREIFDIYDRVKQQSSTQDRQIQAWFVAEEAIKEWEADALHEVNARTAVGQPHVRADWALHEARILLQAVHRACNITDFQ